MKDGDIDIGFTGSEGGMTQKQMDQFDRYLNELVTTRRGTINFHHGDCVGADAEAHQIALSFATTPGWIRIHIHPPTNPKSRAFCRGDVMHPEKPYLERNQDIAKSDVLIASPRTLHEERRSGTWATVRYAKKNGKQVIILKP